MALLPKTQEHVFLLLLVLCLKRIRENHFATLAKNPAHGPLHRQKSRRFYRFVTKLTVSYLEQKTQMQVKYSKNNLSIPEHV